MNIIIEIGDKENQKKIRDEITLFLQIADYLEPPIKLDQVYIPSDLEKTVNNLNSSTSFKTKRGVDNGSVQVLGKIVDSKLGTTILIAPDLYHPNFDTKIRCFIFCHELIHLHNRNLFPDIHSDSFTRNSYLGNMYGLFDEYIADRTSFKITESLFPDSQSWNKFNRNSFEYYLAPVTNIDIYKRIKREISEFRYHANINLFWKNVNNDIDIITKCTTHAFARFHHYPENYSDFSFQESRFLNKDTFSMMDFLKESYEEGNYDIRNGIEIISQYLTNFGVKFEDKSEGGYIWVLDI